MVYKVAMFDGKIIHTEPAENPRLSDGTYNVAELVEFFHRVKRSHKIAYDNSKVVQYSARYADQ